MSGDAVLQFEINRARWRGYKEIGFHAPNRLLEDMIAGLAKDTLQRGGTLVVVASENTVTIVQRETADEEIEAAANGQNGGEGVESSFNTSETQTYQEVSDAQ